MTEYDDKWGRDNSWMGPVSIGVIVFSILVAVFICYLKS